MRSVLYLTYCSFFCLHIEQLCFVSGQDLKTITDSKVYKMVKRKSGLIITELE